MRKSQPSEQVSTPELRSEEASSGAYPTHSVETEQLTTLYAALDNIENGVILLDRELRAQYVNPAAQTMFKVPQEFVDGKPHFSKMLEHTKRQSAYALSPADVEQHVANRLAWVSSGDQTPVDQHLSSGRVIRCQCAVLQGGGRMLTYSDVTDIVRHAEELERLATTDGMTGIYNRRHFMTLADHEWNRSQRYGRPMSFLMIDIDFFKSINDKFGHEVGDQMIVHLAMLARACKRDSDVLARIGGEEFALLLPETDLAQAQSVAERLRRDVIENPLVAKSDQISTTISIGVATRNDVMAGVADLMKAADHALYNAKGGGRNRVACSTDTGSIPADNLGVSLIPTQ